MRLGELEFVEEYGQPRHFFQGLGPSLDELADLPPGVDDVEGKAGDIHTQKGGFRLGRQRLGEQAFAAAGQSDQEQAGRGEGSPIRVDLRVRRCAGVGEDLVFGIGQASDALEAQLWGGRDLAGSGDEFLAASEIRPEVLGALDLNLLFHHGANGTALRAGSGSAGCRSRSRAGASFTVLTLGTGDARKLGHTPRARMDASPSSSG